jgi:antitoxin component YwqK of YwqJK toxin-antitoxin module
MKVLVILISVLLVNVVFAQKRYQQIVETEYKGDTVVLISTKEPVTGTVYLENKDDGFLMEEQYVNGILNGYSKIITNNVVLKSENYKNGLIDGESKWYYENGQKKFEGFYKEGKQEGITRYWHPNGQLKYEVNMVNGLDEGPLSVFFENGKLECKLSYVKGKVEGVRTEYFESGKMKKTEF